MTTTDELRSGTGTTHQIGMFADRLTGIVHAFAQPSLVQLVMRLALAVPFWRSGINKWDGFLQLKDTTVLLFSEEFMLHLPGGPISLPGSCRLRIHFRLRRDSLPHPPCLRPRHTLCRNGAPMHDMHRRTHRSRWLAGSYYLGRHGIGHYGVGARPGLARLRNSARARTTKRRLPRRQTKQDDRREAG